MERVFFLPTRSLSPDRVCGRHRSRNGLLFARIADRVSSSPLTLGFGSRTHKGGCLSYLRSVISWRSETVRDFPIPTPLRRRVLGSSCGCLFEDGGGEGSSSIAAAVRSMSPHVFFWYTKNLCTWPTSYSSRLHSSHVSSYLTIFLEQSVHYASPGTMAYSFSGELLQSQISCEESMFGRFFHPGRIQWIQFVAPGAWYPLSSEVERFSREGILFPSLVHRRIHGAGSVARSYSHVSS